MEFEALSLSVDAGVGRLRFTDAARGNPIDGRLCAEIGEAGNILSDRDDLRVLIVTAEGPAFSYGGDIAAFMENLDVLPVMIRRWTTVLNMGIARLQRMDAPIVAAVQGVCAGGMAAFVAGCDLVIAAENARFVAAYAGIGYSCDAGASIMLTRRMGLARARRYLLMNESLGAQEALSAGLVDEVVPQAELVERAEAIAAQLAAGPTRAFGATRRLLLSASDQPIETQLELEAQALSRISGSADAREGLTAFSERRQPVFRGL